MSKRTLRRSSERRARKLARQTQAASIGTASAPAVEVIETAPAVVPLFDLPEPGAPFPSLAQLTANRANAQLSTGPKTEQGLAISSQNHTVHGLTRHNGSFKLLASENQSEFDSFKQSLLDEHQPITATEGILVTSMAESHWLSNRAASLQQTCFDPESGAITNEKTFSLYLRYQTTHTRAFHKSLNDLLKLRAEKRKTEIGFEAQKRQEAAAQIKSEQHAMKKQTHYWDLLRKDGEACHQIAKNTLQNLAALNEFPAFEAQFAAELAARSLKKGEFQTAASAAA
jgi:hypothetical protein